MVQFNVESAVAAYAAAHPTADGCHAPFDDRARAGLTGFLESLHADDSIESVSQAAYLLGVTEHYTTGQWVPIADPTRGAGYLYATPVVVQLEDKSLKKVAYFPRGFARLTWDIAYLTVGRVIGKDLLRYPELVMEPAIAYQALAAMVANKMVEPTEWDYGKIQSYARMWDRWIEAAARTPRPDSDYIPASVIAEALKSKACPVCDYDMENGPWDYNICPRCKTEFGLHDVNSSVATLRELWLAGKLPEVIAEPSVDPQPALASVDQEPLALPEPEAKPPVEAEVPVEAPPPPPPPPAKRKSRKPAAPQAPAAE